MQTRTVDVMLELIACAIEKREPSRERLGALEGEALAELYSLSRHHDMAHLVGYALERHVLLDRTSEYGAKFQKQTMLAFWRYERLQYEYEQICRVLGEAEIDYLPLKGSVLRAAYPEPWMRTSCDIDVLIRRDDLVRAEQALCERLSYRKDAESTHDVSFFAPSEVNLELHFELNENDYRCFSCLVTERVWASAVASKEDVHRFCLPDEIFYFYHIAHMAKHFVNSGCGVRPLIDLWILDRADETCRTARDELLAREGLLPFAEMARSLSAVWLAGAEHDAQTAFAEEYILKGGVYGSEENQAVIRQIRQGGRLRYAMRRIFLPYADMRDTYPCLQKHPYLLPVMHVRRWLRIVFGGRLRHSIDELSANQAVDRNEARSIEQMIDTLGIAPNPQNEDS